MFDVVALGECLIDFTPNGMNQLGAETFARNPGGAPANVLAMVAKLGGKTAFIGKVGKDRFGDFLEEVVCGAGIDTSGLVRSQETPTTLAFVQLDKNGDRSFSFYRHPGADIELNAEEVPGDLLENCGIFHFGSVSLTDEPCKTATLESAVKAKKSGAIISYDPNYRAPLWENGDVAKESILSALPLAHIVKVSEEEMIMLTQEQDLVKGSKLLASHGAALVVVTLGSKGAFFYTDTASGMLPTYDVKTVDTTGAGDAFWGALLYTLRRKSLKDIYRLNRQDLEKMVDFSNAAGSLATTKPGAIPAMPSLAEIEKCQAEVPRLME